MHQHPGVEVFVEGLLQLQFLGPLAVVGDIRRIDAGAAHGELIQDLDGLQFDEARAAEPARDDVLGELGVGPGGHAQRRRQASPEDAAFEPGARYLDVRLGNAQHRSLVLQFLEDPAGEPFQRKWTKGLLHHRAPLGFFPRALGSFKGSVVRRMPSKAQSALATAAAVGTRPISPTPLAP